MYIAAVTLLMFVFPALSVLAELLVFKSPLGLVLLVGKWFVFWSVGVRLFSAGLRQVIRPDLTAEGIFGIAGKEPLVLVQELGFANISMGALGICTIFRPRWILPAALVGGLFYGFAGFRHAMHRGRNTDRNVAMISDFFLFGVMLVYFVAEVAQ